MIDFDLIDDRAPSLYDGPTLFKLDSTGRLRTWKMQIDGEGRYRTLSGLADGKQAESGWTTPVPRSCDTQKDQGEFEVRAQYKHQLDREYHATKDSVSVPKMIEPMLAKSYDRWPGLGYSQPKLDGIRCIATVEGLFTRQGQPITAVPHIHAAMGPLFAQNPDLIFDGELYNHDLREDFGAISSIVRKKNPTVEQLELAESVMQYHVYDIIDPTVPFTIRNNWRMTLVSGLRCDWIVNVGTVWCQTQEDADRHYGEAIGAGFEGGMYRLDAEYELGRRSKTLLKRKDFMTREYPLKRLEEGNGNWAGAAKRAILQNDDGTEFGAGIRGSYAAGVALLDLVLTDDAVATLRFFGLSLDGVPRFPVVIDIHPAGRVD